MIVSQFRFHTTKRQRYRLPITNLESVARRFRVDFTAVAPGLPATAIAQRVRDTTALNGFDSKIDWMVLAGHVELNCPPVMETRTRGRSALGHAVRVLRSAACVKTEEEIESAPGLPGLPLDPEILIGPNLLASGKSEHLIEPESWATAATSVTAARRAVKRRGAKRHITAARRTR